MQHAGEVRKHFVIDVCQSNSQIPQIRHELKESEVVVTGHGVFVAVLGTVPVRTVILPGRIRGVNFVIVGGVSEVVAYDHNFRYLFEIIFSYSQRMILSLKKKRNPRRKRSGLKAGDEEELLATPPKRDEATGLWS